MDRPIPKSGLPREEAIFNAAVEIEDASQRNAYLDQACAGDAPLRARLAKLFAALDDPFFEAPLSAPHRVAFENVPESAAALARTPAETRPPEATGDQLGPYRLIQKIGEGGCGVVYVARQEQPVRREVALKLIKLGMDTREVVARFEAERQALAMMEHPNIAKVHDAGVTDTGRPYFVMEFVRGIKITEFCYERKLSVTERLKLFIQVCQAIQHAHQKGIIHRDIKPSNILVTTIDGVPVPKVIDFGIAKATAGQKLTDQTLFTAFEQFLGTPAYMSPEQAEMTNPDIDTRSDIYSLGVLLYELLTGATPFDTRELLKVGLDELRRTIREKEPLRPSARLDRERTHLVRGDLDWIVMKCLEKDRTRRYETANGLARDIERHLNQEPVLAGPPSRLYRFQKLIRRNRLTAIAAAAALLFLLFGVAGTIWQAVRATRLRDKAQLAQERAEASDRESRHRLYAAQMNLAQAAWDLNNIGRVRQLLEQTETNSDRNFEWFYWQRQVHLMARSFRVPGSRMAISPDGQHVVASRGDTMATVCDTTSGQELFPLIGHHAAISLLTYSPNGQRLLTAANDPFEPTNSPAIIWEAATGKQLLTLDGDGHNFHAAAFSRDNQRIVAGFLDKAARVWDASGTRLLTLPHRDAVESVAFSPDGARIVTGSADGIARIWDATSGRNLRELAEHRSGISVVAFFPDNERIITGSLDGTVLVWDAASGQQLLNLRGHSGAISSAAFSQDGRFIATASADQTARVWDAAHGQEVFTLKGQTASIGAVAFSPNAQWIFTGSADGTVAVWDAGKGTEALTLLGHGAWIRSVAFSPDGRLIATGSGDWQGHDNTARIWDAIGGQPRLTLPRHEGFGVTAVAFSPDSQRIGTGSHDDTARVCDTVTGRLLLTLTANGNGIWAVAFSPDGQRILTGAENGTTTVWDANSGNRVLDLKSDNRVLDPRWDANRIRAAAFSPDGRRIVTCSTVARVWDASTGRGLLTFGRHKDVVTSLAFSPDGLKIVTGSLDQTARVWDAATGEELLVLQGHGGPVNSVAFSPDGKRIVTGSDDRTGKVWSADYGFDLLTLTGHTDWVRAVAFSPDGKRIATSSNDKTAKVWQAATPQEVAAWKQEELRTGTRPP